jgi:hypothetical protein
LTMTILTTNGYLNKGKGSLDNDYLDKFDNEFLNKYEKNLKIEKKSYKYVFILRLVVIQILCNFIII